MRSSCAALMDELTKRWSASKACRTPPEGCSETEIAEIQRARHVERLPLMYSEFLRHMGRSISGLEGDLGGLTYPDALKFEGATFGLSQQPDIFFFWYDAQGDCSTYFHVTEDDPLLYWVTYKGYSAQDQSYRLETCELGRLSDWLIDFIGDEMEQADRSHTQSGYDAVAEEYAKRIYDELKDKPLDRQLLTSFAQATQGKGRVCDIGCGPGHVARFVHDAGADAFGLDLSPGMVETARRLNPGIDFQQGDMSQLRFEDNSLAGLTAFYSIIHIRREDVTGVLREFRRVLKPGGLLLLAFHRGDEVRHVDEWWDKVVSIDFTFFQPDEMSGYVREAGLSVDEVIEREPYPEVEHPSQRVYIFASKPAE